MAVLLFVLLSIIELGFMVREILTSSAKKEWTRKRMVINCSQLVIFLIMVLFPGIDLSFRFTAMLTILIVRIAVSLIIMLASRKNTKLKNKASIVLSAVISIVLIAVNLIPAFVFADYHGRTLTGDYSVSQEHAILIDHSRTEEFEDDGSYREVPVHFYYPEDCDEKDTLPLIVFSHGAFGYYQSNSSTFMELASHGYVVVSLDHPYHSFFTKDSQGRTITVSPDFFSSALKIGGSEDGTYSEEEIYSVTSAWMELREADVNFVIDTLKAAADGGYNDSWFFTEDDRSGIDAAIDLIDTDTIGLIGHSLGGATAVTVGRRDDISAVIDLDGTMLGEETGVQGGIPSVNEQPYTTPLLCIDQESHHRDIAGEPMYVNSVILRRATEGFEVGLIGAKHMDLTDLPLFSPVLAKNLGSGDIDNGKCIDTVNGLVLRFFDCYLKGEGTFEVPDTIDLNGNDY